MTTQPLFGNLASLDELFSDFAFFPSHREAPAGYFPLLGLPGSVDLKGRNFLFAKPRTTICDGVRMRCTNGVIGGFRAVRSAYYMRQGSLPVFAHDLPHHADIHIALVPYHEHDRFERTGEISGI